jgi:hypothetical protein
VRVFNLGPSQDKFERVLYQDIVQISQKISAYMKLKEHKTFERNDGDQSYIDRVKHFRNLQVLDNNYLKQKERVLWPLYTFKRNAGFSQKEDTELAAKRFGKNSRLFHKLQSVQAIKNLQPLKSGRRD